MESDPNFAENNPYIFGDFSKNNLNQYKEQHHLKIFPSPINPISMIPTSSYKVAHIDKPQREFTGTQNPIVVAPNGKQQAEATHGCLNTTKGIFTLSKKHQLQYGESSQLQGSSSQSPSPVDDGHPSLSIKSKHQDDQGLNLRDQKRQKTIEKNSENEHKHSNIIKGQWTAKENGLLLQLIKIYGFNWSEIGMFMEGRTGKQCRERWYNHLAPNIKKNSWSEEEEIELIEAHKKHGNQWSVIAKLMHGRSENSIKNHWNTAVRCQSRKRKNRWNRETILHRYIKEITNAKEIEKEHKEDLALPNDEQLGDYVEMKFNNGGDGMASGSGKMGYDEFESNGMEFFSEVPMQEKITNAKETEKEHNEDLALLKDEQLGGYVKIKFNNGDDGMASGCGTMDYDEFESNGMEFFIEVPMQEEITNAKEIEKEHNEDLAFPYDEQLGGYVEMKFNNGDDGMASGSGTMGYDDFESNGMEFFIEVPMQEEITNAKEIEKEHNEDLTLLKDEQPCGYVEMKFNNGDDGMTSESGTMDYDGFESNRMKFFIEDPMQEEMELMKMIYKNP